MEQSIGKVKKYSREYTRTLKDGKKKKYQAEQVQVTIPKQQNIFEDEEEVLIFHKSDAENFESQEDINIALELHNYLLKDKNKKLNDDIQVKDAIISKLNQEIEILNQEIENKQSSNFENKSLFENHYHTDSEFLDLQKSYIILLKKNEILQSELESAKIGELKQQGLANKFRNFILYKTD